MEEGTIYKIWTPIQDISPALVRATIGAEDANFARITVRLAGDRKGHAPKHSWPAVRGGSTISSRRRKRVPHPHRNWLRKGLEPISR